MIDYSKKRKRDAVKCGLPFEDMALADLMSLGWKEEDAYLAIGMYKPAFSDEANLQALSTRIHTNKFLKYLDEKINEREELKKAAKEADKRVKEATEKALASVRGSEGTGEKKEPLTKEELLTQLLEAANLVRYDDPKKYADILAKYADLQKMKQDDVQTEDTTVHFYIPLTCHKCSLYKEQKRFEQPNE